jgi:hypothetical protein
LRKISILVWGSLEKKFVLEAPSKIQNGGEIQDGRQTIKCSRFVKHDENIIEQIFFQTIKWLNNSK